MDANAEIRQVIPQSYPATGQLFNLRGFRSPVIGPEVDRRHRNAQWFQGLGATARPRLSRKCGITLSVLRHKLR